MNTSANSYDAIEQMIFNDGIKIVAVDIHAQHDTLIIVLNTKAALRFSLSNYSSLKKATQQQLSDFTIIANGTGIHWNELDEDLSLKGFLQEQLKKTINMNNAA